MKQGIKKTKSVLAPPPIGSIVDGEIISKDKEGILIDLGPLGIGIIYKKELGQSNKDFKKIKIGGKITAKIMDLENEDGLRELSLKEVSREFFWNEMKEKKERGEIIDVEISGANKGGLLVSMDETMAFIPTSQLSPSHYPVVRDGNKQEILNQLQKLVGKKIKVKVFHLAKRENKIILSEKIK